MLGGGGGVGHPETEIREAGRRSPKNFFRPFGPQFGLKIRGAPGPPGPSPGSATDPDKPYPQSHNPDAFNFISC